MIELEPRRDPIVQDLLGISGRVPLCDLVDFNLSLRDDWNPALKLLGNFA